MIELGARLGDYEVLSEPMSGTMTQVFAVRHVVTQKRAALKLLHRQWRWLPDVVTRFVNERRILLTLRHPHVITVFDIGDDSFGAPYMVLEWLPFSLQRQLGQEPLNPLLALHCASQIAEAMSALHEHGFVHCDLNPQRILMEVPDLFRAALKLSDLGFTKMTTDSDTQQAGGRLEIATGRQSPRPGCEYLAPEQWIGARTVDGAADVYALGVLLFQMLAGRLPFLSADPQALMYQHMFEPPPLMQIPVVARAHVADLLDAMLAKRPEQRPRISDVRQHLIHVRIL